MYSIPQKDPANTIFIGVNIILHATISWKGNKFEKLKILLETILIQQQYVHSDLQNGGMSTMRKNGI